jgi:aldose 1-epimerase
LGRYKAEPTMKVGFSIIVLSDFDSDATAVINTEMGNNLIQFESGGYPVISPPISLNSFKDDLVTNFKYGIPILSPPNRIKKGRYNFQEKVYHLPLNEPPDHHLHGELCSKAWEIVDFGASDEQGAYVTSRFRYAKHPEIMQYFPHPLSFTVTHRLHNGCLQLSGTIVNEGMDEAPFAFGLHPYFTVPFENEEEIKLHVPAAAEWPVTNEAFVTGEPSVTEFSQSLNKGINIANYPKLGCSLLSLEQGDRTCRIEIMNRGYSIAYQLDHQFPFLVLFRPDWSSAFSLEPYTYVTDAFNLPYAYEVTGAKGIQAGEEIAFITRLWIEST